MRIKFLSFIASFFMVSFVITSCLDNDNDVDYSPDATIHAFELDTIGYGVNYKFTIDQANGLIYNEDSLPVHADTIINKILIKTLTTASGLVTMKSTEDRDSLVNINDSIDLLKYVNAPEEGKYLKFTVWAPDGLTKKDYNITVRVHHQVPDSLNWGKEPIASNPANSAEKLKLVIVNDKILLFTENSNSNKVYSVTIPAASTPINPLSYGKNWEEEEAIIPEGAKISSIVSFLNNLYLATTDGEVYSSGDGLNWTKNEALSQMHTTNLITSFSNNDGSNHKKIIGIAGIIEEGGKRYFHFTNEDATAWSETKGKEIPDNFPIDNLSADVYSTESGTLNAIVVGNTKEGIANDTATVVWASEDGKDWIPMIIESNNNCPKLIDPSIIHYNDAFYICGKDKKDDTKGFEKFYTSPTLLVWKGVDNKFMLPGVLPEEETPTTFSANGFSGKIANYSMIVDRNHFIWMVGGSGINEIWRGRVNRFGFKIQE